jgi:hypothetical protein
MGEQEPNYSLVYCLWVKTHHNQQKMLSRFLFLKIVCVWTFTEPILKGGSMNYIHCKVV